MSNHLGGPHILSATLTPLSSQRAAAGHIQIRNSAGNGIVYFAKDTTTITGWIAAGEAKEYWNISPSDIYLKGSSGEIVYWDGDGSPIQEFQR